MSCAYGDVARGDAVFWSQFPIFDNVKRWTHQSARPRISLRWYLRARLSVLPIAHIYLSVPSVSALPSIRPSSPSVHLSTSARPSRVTQRIACAMRACVHTYPIYPTCPPVSLLSHSLSHFHVSISAYLPFRSRWPSSAPRSHLDLTRRLDRPRDRPNARPFGLLALHYRKSRESPGTRRAAPREEVSRALATRR